MDYKDYKQQVFDTTMDLVKIDLIRISSGNISLRLPDGDIAITPSNVLYSQMRPDDIVIMDLDNQLVQGNYQPSSEKHLHTEIYKARPDVMAVVHVHSRYAIAFSAVGMELPVCNIEILAIGGPVPVAPYQVPGTVEVGLGAARIFSARPGLKALMLERHGLVAIGRDLSEAYQGAYKAETGAEIYHLALQTGREVKVFTPDQIEEVFSSYQRPKEENGS